MRPWLPYWVHRITRWPSLLRAAVFLLLTAAPPLFCELELDDDDMYGYGYPSCNFCAPAVPACTAYLTFRPAPPFYTSPVSVSYLLNANASAVAAANNITLAELPVLPNNHKLLVPVPCSCSYSGYYQHNTTYVIREGSMSYNIARVSFQNLTTYHAINHLNEVNYYEHAALVNSIITVPLICACPSAQQAAAGVRHMVTYDAGEEDEHTVAHRFGIDLHALRSANLFPGHYNFTEGDTTLLVPLKNPPTPDMLALLDPPAPAPAAAPVVVPASHCQPWSRRWIDVGVGSGCGVVVSAGIVTLHILCRRRRRRRLQHDRMLGKETSLVAAVRDAVDSLVVYTYLELDRATAGFAEERRVAGSSVFRAVINGQAFAVKRVAADVRGEVGLLARVNHSCLIRLSGLCVHRGDTYLVLEFAENGALSDWLHGGGDTACLLNWNQRVQVACDVARGLNYLHHFTSPPYVHKNLSSCNVLLDAKFRARVSNFGLARAVAAGSDGGAVQATRHVVGTHGYLAPEYLEHGLISTHLDVFTFGVILLELLSGKEAVFVAADGHASLLWEAVEGIAGSDDVWFKLKEFMDPRLHGHYPFGLAFTMAALALRCVAREPRARPSMSKVLVLLSAVHDSTVDWDPQNYGVSESMLVGR
ncbi:protein LYK5-like [Miscanthus floridulus]|uniref:protein LYK5-like n=1 Tax=Miscanthus floridulus TaxID=154761 RepID=UPI003459CEA2